MYRRVFALQNIVVMFRVIVATIVCDILKVDSVNHRTKSREYSYSNWQSNVFIDSFDIIFHVVVASSLTFITRRVKKISYLGLISSLARMIT